MNNFSLAEEFVEYVRDERHLSNDTVRCYGADLRQYVEYLHEQPVSVQLTGSGHSTDQSMAIADEMAVRRFLTQLDRRGYSPATIARKITTLRNFYRWLVKRGRISTNPMQLVRTPKQAKRSPKAIPAEK